MKHNTKLSHHSILTSFIARVRTLICTLVIGTITLLMQHSWCNIDTQVHNAAEQLDNAYTLAFDALSNTAPQLLFDSIADVHTTRQKILQSEQRASALMSSLIRNNINLFNSTMADYLTRNVINKYDATQRALYKALLDYYNTLIATNLDHAEQQTAIATLKRAIELSSPLASTPTPPISVKDRYLNLIDSCTSLFSPKRFSSKILPNKKVEQKQQEIQRFILDSIDKLHYAILKTESSVINALRANQPSRQSQENPVITPERESEMPVAIPDK